MKAAYSLRRRLLALALGVTALGWAAVAGLAFQSAHREADRLFDAQLRQVAETLAAIVAGGEARHVAHELEEHADRYDLPVIYQVWRTEGEGRPEELLVRSPGAPEAPLALAPGFGERDWNGVAWRLLLLAREDYRVIVGHDHAARYRAAAALALALVWPILVGLPVMGALLWWGIGRALGPVGRVAREVAGLRPEQPVPVGAGAALPEEVAPLVAAINDLTARVARALDKERRFTADAAHELRTPLAALKVQAQLAQRAQGGDTRERALEQVLAAADRMARLVEQLLVLARVDPESGRQPFEAVDLARLAEALCAERAPTALARGYSLELAATPARARGWGPWLEILLGNLVDNALRHTPPGSRIVVSTGADSARAWLAVRDDGPGIPPDQREALLGRFARGPDAAEDGCGLGLSIVERIAEAHGARLALEEGLEGLGLGVRISLPGA